jgi:DNA-binding response OmpR family regulator
MTKTIYVADDEKNIRSLMETFLKSAGFNVKTFENGDLLYQAFEEEKPDLIVLDIMMPGTDGLTICSNIRKISQIPIIIVSARDTELDRITGITIGSDDYLVKPFSPVELIARIQGIFRRMSYQELHAKETSLTFEAMNINEETKVVTYKNKVFDVSPTEFDFLSYMFLNQQRAVSREELLKHVWHFDASVDTRATDDVVKRLRKKLMPTHVRIAAVWGFGFRLEKKDENNPS